jgi:hypothetical protein
MADNIFNFVYNVTKNDNGSYTVGSPFSTKAAVTDAGNSGKIGDTPSGKEVFTYNTVNYSYEGLASNGGFIASIGTGKDVKYYLFTDSEASGLILTTTKAPTTICFLPGTQIATPQGEVDVESLRRGDLVETADGRAVPVRWVGRQTISTLFADPLRVLPICIKAGALAENVPSRDLYVSPDHAILIDDILVHASALVNGTSIVRAPAPARTFIYYHVELADHSLLLADNVPAESFIDNVDRLAFDNWDEHEGLGDETAPLVEMAYPRAKAARQVPVAMRERLAARAQALFGAVATQAA